MELNAKETHKNNAIKELFIVPTILTLLI